MKIYTRTGDKGQTSLFGGERVSKSNPRVQAYGTFDELNSILGLVIAEADGKKNLSSIAPWCLEVQKDLFALGAWLASPKACENIVAGKPAYEGGRKDRTTLNDARITEFENDIDDWEEKLEPMKAFILPGGTTTASTLHIARTICRRAERECVALQESGEVIPEYVIRYLNRLADALFVLARFANHCEGKSEILWNS